VNSLPEKKAHGHREGKSMSRTSLLMTGIVTLPLALGDVASAQTTARKPNIVMIMADDVGI
jgi:hypothetical protein